MSYRQFSEWHCLRYLLSVMFETVSLVDDGTVLDQLEVLNESVSFNYTFFTLNSQSIRILTRLLHIVLFLNKHNFSHTTSPFNTSVPQLISKNSKAHASHLPKHSIILSARFFDVNINTMSYANMYTWGISLWLQYVNTTKLSTK